MGKAAVCLIAFLLLVLRFHFFFSSSEKIVNNDTIRVHYTIREEPVVIDGKQRFRISLPTGQKATVMTGVSPFLHYGDTVVIEGRFTEREYKGKTFGSIYFPKLQIVNSDQNIFTKSSYFIHNKAKKTFEDTLPPNSASLLLGMIFGGREGIDDTFLKNLQDVGVVHVIAASGMNVSFVAGALLIFFGAFVKRQYAIFFSSLGVVWYAFLAGFEPSIVRASIMAVIAFAAGLLGRQNFPLLSLVITGYVMLFTDPRLLTDIGFQLSFMATLGIILINPLSFSKNMFVEDVKTTFSAQIATLPILLATFGKYSLISIPVNALVLWTVPFLMVFGSLAVVSDMVFQPVAKIFLFLCLPFLLYFEIVVSFFAKIGFAVVVSAFSIWLSVSYYLLVASLFLFVTRFKSYRERGSVKT